MIVNLVEWQRPFSRTNTLCSASPPPSSAHHFRQQLDNLLKEADYTRAKANNARLRLMRLSEATEKLRRQATVSVRTGKENDARELLFQKKKVIQAMEKLKGRIELFDELSAKLNEAISMKESLLFENMALDHEDSETEALGPVRIVSPTEENLIASDDSHPENEPNKEPFGIKRLTGANNVEVMREISTYEDFMNNLDQQLNKIEEEIQTFLSYSNSLSGNKEIHIHSTVHHVTEILVGVRRIRERLHLNQPNCHQEL